MTEITPGQIKARAMEIGDKPAFPVHPDASKLYTGMTYRQYLIGQYVANPTGSKMNMLEDVQYVPECLAKSELEAENNLEQ